MTKLFKPVMGTPIDDYLVRMVADVKEDHQNNPSTGPRMSRSAKEVESIAESVRRSLNTGACMNESQAAEVRNSILFDRRADATVVKELIDRVNGFRLDCENCLREGCPQRDPVLPLTNLEQRTLEQKGKMTVGELLDEMPEGIAVAVRTRALISLSGFYQNQEGCQDDIGTIEELCRKSPRQLMRRKGFGSKSLELIELALAKHGLSLRKD